MKELNQSQYQGWRNQHSAYQSADLPTPTDIRICELPRAFGDVFSTYSFLLATASAEFQCAIVHIDRISKTSQRFHLVSETADRDVLLQNRMSIANQVSSSFHVPPVL